MTLDPEFLARVAPMERSELFDALDAAESAAHKATIKLDKAQQNESRAKKALSEALGAKTTYIVALDSTEADYARRRMGLEGRKCVYVYTGTDHPRHQLRGVTMRPDEIRLVRGWTRGLYAHDAISLLYMAMNSDPSKPVAGIEQLSYAPDPHDETSKFVFRHPTPLVP